MKQLILFIICSFFYIGSTCGQHTKELKLSFNKSDFLFEEIEGHLSISSAKHPIQYGEDTSEPGLPIVIVHFLIGADEKYSGVEFRYTEAPLFRDIFVKNNPTYKVRGSKGASDPERRVTSYSRALYPVENVRYMGTHLVDGYKYITFLVCPFKYQTQHRQLNLLSDISLKIQLSPSKKSPQKAGRAMRDIVKRIVVNGEEMPTLYETPIVNYRNTFSRDIRSGNDPFDYLIITAESQKSAYQDLADWKTRKGVRTKVVTKEHIDSTFSCYTHDGHECYPLAFKRAIKYYKDNFDIQYVLLGGDTQFIPSLDVYINYGGGLSSAVTPCDLYYACLSGTFGHFEWNNNPDDGGYGTYGDEVDYHPQLSVSRLSTNSLSDANVQVRRIIDYERAPVSEEWRDTLLMMGCKFKDIYNDGRPKSDVEIKGNTMWEYYLQCYWTEGHRYNFYDTKTSHPDGADYDVSVENFIERFQQGYPFIHIDTHGGTDNMGLEQETLFSSDVQNVNNPSESIIVTSACNTNAFDSDECLSEALMRSNKSGAIGYWGGSRIVPGIQDERSLGPVDFLNMKFYEHLFCDDEPRLGNIANMTKLFFITSHDSLYSNMPYSDPYRGILFTMNILGDPEMPIYTSSPQSMYYRDLYFENDSSLFVNFAEMGACRVCVMSLEDNGNRYYQVDDCFFGNGSTDGLHLSLPTDKNYSICITKPNFKPYVLNLYRTGYVQNDTIANDAVVLSYSANIGRNVTPLKPSGPVSVEKGDMIIRTKGGVTINDSFKVKKGATLTIDPNFIELFDDPDQ